MTKFSWPAEFDDERISVLATALAAAREEAQTLEDSGAGDTAWGTGCRAYERACFKIRELAKREEWLSILVGEAGGLEFVFAVGGVPLRFCRGDDERIPVSRARRNDAESRAHEMLFETMPTSCEVFRLVVDVCDDGLADEIWLVAADSNGEVIDARQVEVIGARHEVPSSDEAPVVRHRGTARKERA